MPPPPSLSSYRKHHKHHSRIHHPRHLKDVSLTQIPHPMTVSRTQVPSSQPNPLATCYNHAPTGHTRSHTSQLPAQSAHSKGLTCQSLKNTLGPNIQYCPGACLSKGPGATWRGPFGGPSLTGCVAHQTDLALDSTGTCPHTVQWPPKHTQNTADQQLQWVPISVLLSAPLGPAFSTPPTPISQSRSPDKCPTSGPA